MEETTEQLRKLLRSADLSAEAKDGRDLREASTIDNSETHLHELASLLGSLNIDLATPEKKAKKDHKGPVEVSNAVIVTTVTCCVCGFFYLL